MAHLLGADALHVEYPTGVVFSSLTLGVAEGDRIGIVGRNGEGKSTLLGLLAGRIPPDSGRVTMRGGTAVRMLDQSDTLDPSLTVGHAIVGDADEHEWAGDPRIRDIVDGLVSAVAWDAVLGDLSGGQRRRVGLAAALAGSTDLLFLDEPTNHLDLEAITWLAAHLRTRWVPGDGGLLVVTHDRWFLDEVCTTTWEVYDGTVDAFEGGYAAYVLQRVERDRLAEVAEAKRQNLMRKELAWLRRGAPARTTKAKFRVETANALIADEPPVRDKVELVRLATARLGRQVVDLLDVSVSFGGTPVLRGIEWRIGPGERSGIMGANGAGKTTLLNVVTGAVEPTTGTVRRGKTVRVGILTQEPAALDEHPEERVRDVLRSARRPSYMAAGRELTPGQLLERLGFTNAHLSMPVGTLSGGQRRRLQLLLILLDEPNVLILDEPSNDLDTDMLAAMEDLLDSWPGTLLVVSHDRYLMERVTDQQYALIDGRFVHLPGGVDQYLALVPSAQPVRDGAAPVTVRRSGGAAQRAAAKELASVERRLAKIPAQITDAEARLAAHDQSDYVGLMTHLEALDELKRRQSELEARWLELSEGIDRGR